MTRRFIWATVVVIIAGGCGRLGTGLPSCRTPSSDPNPATVLTLQAVPEAKYTPCLNALELGWDEVDFHVESGRASLDFRRDLRPFLEVALTPSCDVGKAVEVPSGIDDVTRYENIFQVSDAISVTIIPDGERPRIYALSLAAELDDLMIDDRPVVFTVDEDTDFAVRDRVNRALFNEDFVWIISDLDIDEKTLEMRASPEGEGARGLRVDEAIDRIARMSDEVQYRGQWFLVFEGGCITYDFDAEGSLAASIAQDAEQTIGLYSGDDLRRAARDAGYDIIGD
jgi:hypothetical protein